MVNVICMKWGNKYGPEYVNRLANMVRRHLVRPYRFVCFTDDNKGIQPDVEYAPIPDMPVQLKGPERGWTKLTTFSKELYTLSGPTLFLDLDILIIDSLDEFFEMSGDVIIVREYHRQHGKGNSSIYRFNIGSHPDVYTNFTSNYDLNIRKYRNEQTYLSDYLANKGVLSFWPETWVRNFKRHCMHYFPKSLFVPPILPANTRILIFHGRPNPEEAIVGKTGKWYRFARPAKWILDYWK